MKKIIIFTDCHILAAAGANAGPHERLRIGLDHACTRHGDAERIVFTGDLADKGDKASYELLKEIVETASLPVSLMIGNHDNREHFLDVFPHTPVTETGHVQSAFDLGTWRMVMLDTLFAPPYDYPKSHAGFLCSDRLVWLESELKLATDRPVAILMHHPPHKTGFAGMDFIRLSNGDEFHELVARYQNVQHMVFGHVHRTMSGISRGIPYAIFKSTQVQMPMEQNVPDTSLSVVEPPAYGIIQYGEDGSVIVNTEDFM